MPNYKPLTAALEQLLTKMPAEAAATRKAFELEKEFEAAKKAEAYAPHTLPTSSGNAALNQARQILQSAPKDSGVVDLNDVINHHIERHAKGGSVHMATGGKASQEFPLQDMQEKKLSPLEEDTYNTFGMLPDEDRLSILPRYMKDKGFIAPQFIYDAAKAIQAPSTSLHAELSPEDAMNVALNAMGSSSVAASPKGALRSGMAYKAADRAKAGNKAAKMIKSQPKVKASEALGQLMEQRHKKVSTTQSDRTRVGKGNIGGAQFPAISQVDPAYAGKVWGVMDEGTASRLINLSDAATLWTTMLGSEHQLKSNPIVFDKLRKQFFDALKQGKLSPELEAKINQNLALTFGEGAEIRDPNIWKDANTFEKRSKLGDIMMGQGIPPKEGGIALGGEKSGKGVIFKPTDTLMSDTEPGLLHPEHGGDVPTYALGPRLFKFSGSAEYRPDLHPGFPTLLHGEDMGYNFDPVPTEVFLPEWHEEFKKKNPNRKPGYYDLALGVKGEGLPSQDLHDEYIRHLIREGYAEGGAVHMAEGGLPEGGENIDYKDAGNILDQVVGFKDPNSPMTGLAANVHASPLDNLDVNLRAALLKNAAPHDIKQLMLNIELANRMGININEKGLADLYATIPNSGFRIGYNPSAKAGYVGYGKHFATGGVASQEFPLQVAPNPTEADLTPNELHPIAGGLARALSSVHGFVSKPFGYDNPPAELASSLLGIPDIAKSLENYAYGTPNTTGSGQTLKASPELESAIMSVAPMVPAAGRQIVKGAKALAPTAAEMMLDIAEKGGTPVRMMAAPEGKAGKIKAPANDIGFYNPVEKAALNLQRKKGAGNAMLADLKKQPGVNDERLAELGLGDLATRPEITKDELIATINQNRIPLEESVKGAPSKEAIINETANIIQETLEAGQVFDDDAANFLDRWKKANLSGRTDRQSEASLEEYLRNAGDNSSVSELMASSEPYVTEGVAKFGPETHPNYNTPGGKNYREIRMKVPDTSKKEFAFEAFDPATQRSQRFATEVEARDALKDMPGGVLAKVETSESNPAFYNKNHHGDEPNVLLHLRLADHTDAEGKSGLLIDELQSDWHQEGREKGYGNKVNEQGHYVVGIPDAPFKDNWYQLGLKRAIKEAADTGMDRVYLTTGKTQNERYDLSKHISRLEWKAKPGSETGSLLGWDKFGENVLDKQINASEIEDYVGKDVAKNIVESPINHMKASGAEVRRIEGANLQVGGAGMRQYYDKNYLNYLKRYAKQHGATVGETTLSSAAKTKADLSSKDMHDLMDNPEFKKVLDEEYLKIISKNGTTQYNDSYNSERAWNAALKRIGGEKVYYMDMTPQMRESTIKGQSYKDGGAVSLDHVIHHSIKKHASKKMATGGDASQTFPLQEDKPAVVRNRAGQIVYDPSEMIPGAAKGLWNTLAGTLRGRIVGAAGMAGDIMGSLNDMGTQIQDTVGSTLPARRNPATPKPNYSLPTTEELDKMLPSAGDSQEAQVGNELGKMMPLTLDELAPAGRLIAKGAKALQPTAMDMLQMQLEKASSPTRSYAVKPKGGNWLNDSVEGSTSGLKAFPLGETPESRIAHHEEMLKLGDALTPDQLERAKYHLELSKNDAVINKWVDQKLNKYIKNEMGTPEDPIRLGIERRAEAVKEFRKTGQARLDKMAADIDRAQAAGKDTTLSEQDYEAAKEKFYEDLDVASNDLYHSPMPEEGWADRARWVPESLGDKRMVAGFPEEGMATHPAAKVWERATDTELEHYLGRNLNAEHLKGTRLLEENPWISKLKPEDKVYKLDQFATRGNLEFGHMIDEVKNAMNPNSILPKNLRISAKDLEKMTVDDISALVGKINGWRRIQKTKANLDIANNPATHTFKEYPPENNPKGVSWKQIKLPEGLPKDEAEQAVRKATEYEGSIMRHCVGGSGHCEPLLRGDVELYTLRDAKGEPHATIEVEPFEKHLTKSEIPEDVMNDLIVQGEQLGRKRSDALGHSPYSEESHYEERAAVEKTIHDWIQKNPVHQKRILEIKGKLNQKPKEEYIPFIQDFVQSGDWKSVGDLHHTDLVKSADALDFIDEGMLKKYKEELKNLPKYITKSQKDDLLYWALGHGNMPKFAGGGSVSLDHVIQRSIKKHAARRMAEGGAAYNTNPDMSDGGLFIQGSAF